MVIERGAPYPLAPAAEHNLLRIGQETATNAAKPGGSHHIHVDPTQAVTGAIACGILYVG